MVNEHGGNIYLNDIIYDFSANINPLGLPENVKNALVNSIDMWDKYPDPYCTELTEKLSAKIGVAPENIVCGNGAADLVYRVIYTFKPKTAVICTPSFSEYEKALNEVGSKIITYNLSEENNFILGEKILDILDKNIDMLILASPNNPTGKIISPEILEKICRKCSENNIIFLCDECFMDFVKYDEKFTARNFLNENVIVLKAFTKIYSMAGLRLGYAIFDDPEKAVLVKQTGQFWSVSTPAQIAGIAALDEDNYVKNTLEIIEKERDFLQNEFLKLNIKIFSSDANFILFKCNFPLDDMLLKEKILIRNCGNFKGLNDKFFRIAVRSHNENTVLISALRRILNG